MDTELTLADPIGGVFELERARTCDRQEWRIEHHLAEHQLEEDRTRMRQLSSPGGYATHNELVATHAASKLSLG